MKFLSKLSDDLLCILNPYKEWFFSQTDHDLLCEKDRTGGEDYITAVSDEYLKKNIR